MIGARNANSIAATPATSTANEGRVQAFGRPSHLRFEVMALGRFYLEDLGGNHQIRAVAEIAEAEPERPPITGHWYITTSIILAGAAAIANEVGLISAPVASNCGIEPAIPLALAGACCS